MTFVQNYVSIVNSLTKNMSAPEPFFMKYIPPGLGKQQDCNFTVPDTYTGYIQRIYAHVDATIGGKVSGYLWINGIPASNPEIASPQMLNHFTSSTSMPFYEQRFYGGIRIPPKTDITLRVTSSSDNAYCAGGFDILLIKNANGV